VSRLPLVGQSATKHMATYPREALGHHVYLPYRGPSASTAVIHSRDYSYVLVLRTRISSRVQHLFVTLYTGKSTGFRGAARSRREGRPTRRSRTAGNTRPASEAAKVLSKNHFRESHSSGAPDAFSIEKLTREDPVSKGHEMVLQIEHSRVRHRGPRCPHEPFGPLRKEHTRLHREVKH